MTTKTCIVLLLVTICVAGCQSRTDASVSMESRIQRECSVGTPAERVEAVLTQLKVEHSFVKTENAFYAIIRNSDSTESLMTQSTSLIIYLDHDGRVKEITERKVYTGP